MKTIPVSLFVVALIGTVEVKAQVADKKRPPAAGEQNRERFGEIWKTADQNQDGALSIEEFSSLPRLQSLPEDQRMQIFERLDKNSNKVIERDEMQRSKPPGHDGENPMRRLWELDKDKDGGIVWEEFTQGEFVQKLPPERQRGLFDRLDTNKDGQITPDDKPKRPDHAGKGPDRQGPFGGQGRQHGTPRSDVLRPSMLPGLDLNKDGSLDFGEFSENPAFSRFDEDDLEKKFEELDRNNDLKLSHEELVPADRAHEKSKRPEQPGQPQRKVVE